MREPLTWDCVLFFHYVKIHWYRYLVIFWKYYFLTRIHFCFIINFVSLKFHLLIWKSIELHFFIFIRFLFNTFRIVELFFIGKIFRFLIQRLNIIDNNISYIYVILWLIRKWWVWWLEFTNLKSSTHFSRSVCWLPFNL